MRCVGCAMDPKNSTNLPKTVDFYFVLITTVPKTCLYASIKFHFSQEHSPAYLRLFMGTIEGLWGPLEVKKKAKMGQNCMFWGESTVYLIATVSILSWLFYQYGQIVCLVIWLQSKTRGDVWGQRASLRGLRTCQRDLRVVRRKCPIFFFAPS